MRSYFGNNKTMRNQTHQLSLDNHLRRQGHESMQTMPFGQKHKQNMVFCKWLVCASHALPAGRKQNHQAPCVYQMHSQKGTLPAEMFARTWPYKHVRNSITEADTAG